jgi:four helix bundle protein
MEKKVRGFEDLDVYQISYKAMLMIYLEILPKLPIEEKYDLKEQLRRSSKAVPRLIAEGHAKRHQKRGFLKYIDDALAESNETPVSLFQVRDLYSSFINQEQCDELITIYDRICRQTYNLALAWEGFSSRNPKTITHSRDST